MNRILITGASGLLGSNLALDLAERSEIIGIVLRHDVDLPGVEVRAVDLSLDGAARQLLEESLPDQVIHCAAAADVDACERDPAMAFRLNRDMAGRVALAASRVGARLIHISTDAVFDGRAASYRESDLPSPVNTYGRSKLAGEQAVMEAYPGALVVRTNIFGWNLPHKLNLAEWFLIRLARGEPSPGLADSWFSPILVNHLTDVLADLLDRDVNGFLHVGGRDCLSKYEFGVKLADRFGYDPRLITPAEIDELKLDARRAKRLCLDSSRAAQILGKPMPSVESGIERLWELRERGQAMLHAGSLVEQRSNRSRRSDQAAIKGDR